MVATVNAIKVLRRKVLFLADIFEKSAEVRANPEYTRRLAQIISQIRTLDGTLKQNAGEIQEGLYSDVASMNLLSSATKGFQTLQDMIKKFNKVSKAMRDHERPYHKGMGQMMMMGGNH